MRYTVAIIGAGLIGKKRAAVLCKFPNCTLQVIADIDKEKAEFLAKDFGAAVETDWEKAINNYNIDIVVVSVINKYSLPIVKFALERDKHVLCEKPLGRNYKEAKEIVDTLIKRNKLSKIILKTGFNHRYHPAIIKAKELLDTATIGKLYFIRCIYGHGGRFGYEKEWRANKNLSGGGELLDQGVHIVDLLRYLVGDFTESFGYTSTYFWDMPVEDNAFAMFKTADGVIATMHASWTQWKNMFSMEIFGSNGYLIVNGLGGSYGTEFLKVGLRNPQGGAPEETSFIFEGEDVSWEKEWQSFLNCLEEKNKISSDHLDGYKASLMIQSVYESALTRRVVKIASVS